MRVLLRTASLALFTVCEELIKKREDKRNKTDHKQDKRPSN